MSPMPGLSITRRARHHWTAGGTFNRYPAARASD